MSIRSAIVTIDDPVDPLVSEATGELAATDAWQSGTRGVTFEGSDITGIRQVGVYRGQTAVAVKTAAGAAAGGCGQLNQGIAYTFTKPCEGARGLDGPQALSIDTRALPDGTSNLRMVVRDTAGNEAENELVVQVDNSPPAAPVVSADGAWSGEASAGWAWGVLSEADRAPVIGVEVERCLGAQVCAVEEVPAGEIGAAMTYEHLVPEGESTVRVRLEDAAGNVGAWSLPSPVRRDRTPPAVAVQAPATAQPGQVLTANVTATDPLAGVDAIEQEVRVGSGEWRTSRGPDSFSPGSVVRFRARARDRVGNLSGWVESAEVRVEPARAPEPAPTPAPTASPAPLLVKRTTRLTDLRARRRGGKVTITGRVRPSAATGTIEARVRGARARARVRAGRFLIRMRFRGAASVITVRYRGDAAHRATSRRVRIARSRG